MKLIAIYGAGGLGREVLMLIRQINENRKEWDPIGFFDDQRPVGTMIDGVPVIGNIDWLNSLKEELFIVIAVAEPHIKLKMLQKITNRNIVFATLIHPSVQMAHYQNSNIGEGTIITAGNIITTGVNIGKHVIINLKNTIGHDAEIGDFVSIMPGCNISGNVRIEECVFIGTAAGIINGVRIARNSKVGIGSVVLQDTREGETVFGVPAKTVSNRKLPDL